MALTPSKMVPLGTKAPAFSLPDTTDGMKEKSFADVRGKEGTVVMFICNHCPYVLHVQDELVRVSAEYQLKGVGFVAISSNDATNYPEDAPEVMAVVAEEHKYPFPYLYDESQDVAKAYDAACTPDIYVFDKDNKLVYRGQLDDSRPGNDEPLDGSSLRAALENLLAGADPIEEQKPSSGCGIKWK